MGSGCSQSICRPKKKKKKTYWEVYKRALCTRNTIYVFEEFSFCHLEAKKDFQEDSTWCDARYESVASVQPVWFRVKTQGVFSLIKEEDNVLLLIVH